MLSSSSIIKTFFKWWLCDFQTHLPDLPFLSRNLPAFFRIRIWDKIYTIYFSHSFLVCSYLYLSGNFCFALFCFGHGLGIWTFLGQRSNQHHSSDNSDPQPDELPENLFYFFLFTAACGSSQAGGLNRAAAAGPCHSYSNAGSKPHLWSTVQFVVTPDP